MANSDSVSKETVSEPTGANSHSGAAKKDKGTVMPLIFGGALACVFGFFAGQLDSVEQALGWGQEDNPLEQVVTAQAGQIEDQAAMIAELQGRLDALPPVPEPVDLTGVETGLAGVETGLSEQVAALDAVSARLTEVEKRPLSDGVSEEAIAAYEAELARFQETLEAQRAEVETVLEDARNKETSAEQNAQVALARAAMTRIVAAVDSGAPFAEAITDLQAASDMDVPAALVASADKGVPTLISVQSALPNAARAALAAARADEAAEGNGGLGGFLERQLGARSTTPQDGDSTDAILSRVEGAVREGRIGDALAEVETLPDVAQATLADWTALAESRQDATAAADELMLVLSAN